MSLKTFFFGRLPVAVAKSLRDEPDAWRGDAYQLVHTSGVTVWTANRTYGMQVYLDEYRTASCWGGVSCLAAFGLSPGHHYLRHAVKRRGADRAEQALKALGGAA